MSVYVTVGEARYRWAGVALFGLAVAVALDAAAAHALPMLAVPERARLFATAQRQHYVAALALLAAGWLPPHWGVRWGRWSVALGVLLFAGSLYLEAVRGWVPFPRLVPLGGSALILGYLLLAFGAWRGVEDER